MTEMPLSLKAGYVNYKIEDWDAKEANSAHRYGETNHQSRTIRIDTSFGHHQTAETLFHELLHVAHRIWNVSDDDDEERTVEALSMGMSTMWRDNPAVFAWISENLTT